MTSTPQRQAPESARPSGGRLRPTGLTVFLAILVVVFAFYTQQAMGMDWRTSAGQIGPGFFPRIIGLIGIALCVAAAIRSLTREGVAEGAAGETGGAGGGEAAEDTDDSEGPPDLGRHSRLLLGVSAALLVLVTFFIPLGALAGGALFMFAVFWLLGNRRPLRDAAFSVLVPLALYLLFDVLLEAGLPEGIVPL